jgi:hypothetical protein
MSRLLTWTVLAGFATLVPIAPAGAEHSRLSIATFQVDATPPLGSPLCDGAVKPADAIVDPLSARGIVLLTAEKPIVLCAVDWVGIGNGGYDAWREALATAAGTTPDRVAVHTLHQHDAPGCDFEAEEILAAHQLSGSMFNVPFARQTIARAAEALGKAIKRPRVVTHIGVGRGKVSAVASSRRLLGPDGKVKVVNYTSGSDPELRAEPEGTIDPDVRLISLWNRDTPLVALTYYATHPQSYYGQGGVSCDFPGLARAMREAELPDVVQIHFNGAGGDITAAKYNDGQPGTRRVLAERLAAGMRAAWNNMQKSPLAGLEVNWRTMEVPLPLSPQLEDEATLVQKIDDETLRPSGRIGAASDLVWVRRSQAGHKSMLSCLRLGPARILHMPGELFVEYQLAAQRMRPRDFVALAAYGDYGPGYIGTKISYSQGGYEPTASRVAPEVEDVLLTAMKELLK